MSRVLVVEDVWTTGGSTCETIRVLEEAGARVVAAGALIDRSGGTIELPVRTEALIDEHWPCVVALASELQKRTSLDHDEATWIVAIAEGERAKKELGGYRTELDAPREREARKKAPKAPSVKPERARKAAK